MVYVKLSRSSSVVEVNINDGIASSNILMQLIIFLFFLIALSDISGIEIVIVKKERKLIEKSSIKSFSLNGIIDMNDGFVTKNNHSDKI
jgi:hypothetical protein